MSEKTEQKTVSIAPPTWQRTAFVLLAVARSGEGLARRDAGNQLGLLGGMLDEALAGMQTACDAATLEDAKAALGEAFGRIKAVKAKAGL